MSNENNNANEQHWKLLVLLLQEICEQRKLTQQDLAELTGLKQSNISRMFSLKYSPNLKTYMIVVKALQLNIFFEPRDANDDLSLAFEKAMDKLGRRTDNLPRN
jgi:transcriptional regulator with XRE-family HTH domain